MKNNFSKSVFSLVKGPCRPPSIWAGGCEVHFGFGPPPCTLSPSQRPYLATLKHAHSLSHSAPCFIFEISEILILIHEFTFLFSLFPGEQGFVLALCFLTAPRTVMGLYEAFQVICRTTEFGINSPGPPSKQADFSW